MTIPRCLARLLTIAAMTLPAAPAAGSGTPDVPVKPVTIRVNTLAEDTGSTVASSRLCSLREAVRSANGESMGGCTAGTTARDTIELPAGTYTLSFVGSDQTAVAGDLDVLRNLRIASVGGTAVIDANGTTTDDRALDVRPGIELTLVGIEVRGGRPAGAGGGISVDDTASLSMTDGAVRNNATNGAFTGGGIYAVGNVTMRRVVVEGNSAAQTGGIALATSSTAVIEDSEIRGNQGGFAAGGITASGGGVNLQIRRSAIVGNVATQETSTSLPGGGLHVVFASVVVEETTISGNATTAGGGGVRVASGSLELSGVTITDNAAGTNGTGEDAGGGLKTSDSTALVVAANTIVAGNTAPDAPDCKGLLDPQGRNLVGDATGCLGTSAHDLVGVDPLLQPLADNGGRSRTHGLAAASPARNAGGLRDGVGVACGGTDQRGMPRSAGGRCDIGAYERVLCRSQPVTRFGGSGKDVITGTSGRDVIRGFGGNDTIKGGGGNDVICGDGGADTLSGGSGKDVLTGGSGKDVLKGGDGGDTLHARDGLRDRVVGGSGRDRARIDRRKDVTRSVEVRI